MKSLIGIVEGFFGPTWSDTARKDYAYFLEKVGADFFIYAPKRDQHLRKAWREIWPESYLEELRSLKNHYQQHNLKFGIGLSPFGLGNNLSKEDLSHLQNKFNILSELGLDLLGLFFDDMPSSDKLLEVQAEVMDLALGYFPKGLIFCPSYYSFDPILDKVFGKRPEGYVEGVGLTMPEEIAVCWTGPKVISEEISEEHLKGVATLLKRKPFIWENLYANDGPKNCKFLKLKDFSGRDASLLKETQGIAFNLMNQPYLSQILFLSSLLTLKGMNPEDAFKKSSQELISPKLAVLIQKHRKLFLEDGLDKIDQTEKESLAFSYSAFAEPVAHEICSWLNGEYIVGTECLTD